MFKGKKRGLKNKSQEPAIKARKSRDGPWRISADTIPTFSNNLPINALFILIPGA